MKILSRNDLALGGFAGIREHRLVTDSRLFAGRKKPETFEGFGQMVYLADARYEPFGESGMHGHSEIDVISIIVEGRVAHEGSMEHGKDLKAGDVQVQRAGGEGFDHNEINPDGHKNRMLQVWALPEKSGQPAAYKAYTPNRHGSTRIYGGDVSQSETFDSRTLIDIVHLQSGEQLTMHHSTLVYVISGKGQFLEDEALYQASEGSLVRSEKLEIIADNDIHLLVVSEHDEKNDC